MKTEIFIHYGLRANNKIKITYCNLVKTINKTKELLSNYLSITQFYCSEISIQAKVFKHNFKNINRF